MELVDFLTQTQAEVRSEIAERFGTPGKGYPYSEIVFAEIVMQHMAQIGMTFEPQICHYGPKKVGGAVVRLTGFALSDDVEQLDLFVSIYSGSNEITSISDADTKAAAEQCLRFFAKCADQRLSASMDKADDAYTFASTIESCYTKIDQVRVYVLTDSQAKAKNFKPRDVGGKNVRLEVVDIERLYRHWSAGKPRDELVVNFEEVSGNALPCVFVPGEEMGYDYALTVIPGEALRFIYERFGARLLEANVRSFLSTTAKVNKGIRDTLREAPSRFMAYNNGIVIVADEIKLRKTLEGGVGILWLKGMQIVNGGQTTASIFFTKRKHPDVDLRQVRVPAKLIVLRSQNSVDEEGLISDISRFANSQNSVKLSDLSANKPFHVGIETLSLSTYCPDGIGRWFYERAAGSYNTLLLREGTTPAKLRQLKESIPTGRKISKTDLAKFLNAWSERPELVSLGSQKNFERFMTAVLGGEGEPEAPMPTVSSYKEMISKAIVFKRTQSLVRPMFPQGQANVAAYLVSLLANRVGQSFDLERVWNRQDISSELRLQLQTWAVEVYDVLVETARGRMISEWAKKPECWIAVRDSTYSELKSGIPEIR